MATNAPLEIGRGYLDYRGRSNVIMGFVKPDGRTKDTSIVWSLQGWWFRKVSGIFVRWCPQTGRVIAGVGAERERDLIGDPHDQVMLVCGLCHEPWDLVVDRCGRTPSHRNPACDVERATVAS